MGLFNKMFGGSQEPKEFDSTPWIELTNLEQLDKIAEDSKTKTQLIFKHSTRCGISRMVIGQFKKDYDLSENQADLFYLDLIAHRNISNAIAERFGVVHESPQLLIIKNGVVVKHDSHGGINEVVLSDFVT